MHDARFARPGTTRFERLRELLRQREHRRDESGTTAQLSQARWIVEAAAGSMPKSEGDSERLLGAAITRPFGRMEGGYRCPSSPRARTRRSGPQSPGGHVVVFFFFVHYMSVLSRQIPEGSWGC